MIAMLRAARAIAGELYVLGPFVTLHLLRIMRHDPRAKWQTCVVPINRNIDRGLLVYSGTTAGFIHATLGWPPIATTFSARMLLVRGKRRSGKVDPEAYQQFKDGALSAREFLLYFGDYTP